MFYKVIFFLYLCFSSIIYSVDENKRIDYYWMYLINTQHWNNDINFEYQIHFYLYLYRLFSSFTEKKWDDRVDIIYLDDKDPFVCLPFIKLLTNHKECDLMYYFKRYEKNIAPSNLPKQVIDQLFIEKNDSNQFSEDQLIWSYNELLYLFYLNFVHICLQYKFFLLCKNLKINVFCYYQKNGKELEVSDYVANISVLRLLLSKETAENFITNVKNTNYDIQQLDGCDKKMIEIVKKSKRTREDYVMFSYLYINYLNRQIIEDFQKKISKSENSYILKKYDSYLLMNHKLFNRKIENNESLDSIIMYVFDELNISQELPVINLLKNTRTPFTKIVKGLNNLINDKDFFDDNSFFLYKIWFYISLGLAVNFNIFFFKELLFGISCKINFEDFMIFFNFSLYCRIKFPDLINNYIKYVYFYIFKLCERKISESQLLNLTCLINIGNMNIFKFANLYINLGINIYKDIYAACRAKFIFELSLLN